MMFSGLVCARRAGCHKLPANLHIFFEITHTLLLFFMRRRPWAASSPALTHTSTGRRKCLPSFPCRCRRGGACEACVAASCACGVSCGAEAADGLCVLRMTSRTGPSPGPLPLFSVSILFSLFSMFLLFYIIAACRVATQVCRLFIYKTWRTVES